MSQLSIEDRLERISQLIAPWPDFPKKGVLFRDIFPLTKNMEVFTDCIALMADYIRNSCQGLDAVVGLESRGFIFGPLIAQQLNVPFIPVRKAGKLPGPTLKVSYALEYGKDEFEIQKNALSEGQKVVIVDDLLATGVFPWPDSRVVGVGLGTLNASCKLMDTAKVEILECVVLIELTDLKGRDKVNYRVKSFLRYSGE